MIPIELQDELENRMKDIFMDMKFKNPKYTKEGGLDEYISINIFPQHLPEKKSSDVSLYPFLLIQMIDGEQLEETSSQAVKVRFITGVYDRDENYQGYRDLTKIIQNVYESLKRNPLIARRFELQFPISWFISDDSPYPYYLGGIETIWSIPTVLREDVEVFI